MKMSYSKSFRNQFSPKQVFGGKKDFHNFTQKFFFSSGRRINSINPLITLATDLIFVKDDS